MTFHEKIGAERIRANNEWKANHLYSHTRTVFISIIIRTVVTHKIVHKYFILISRSNPLWLKMSMYEYVRNQMTHKIFVAI